MSDMNSDNPNSNNGKLSTLEALRERQKQIQAKIDALEARNKAQSRKEDTRLKVLVGAAFLADTEHHEETRAVIRAVLERAITAQHDRDFLKEKGWLRGG